MACKEDKWKNVSYTREELNEKYMYDYEGPLCTYFFDEFPGLKSVYNLSEAEAEMPGEWIGIDSASESILDYYCFFPNKLFVINLDSKYYMFRGVPRICLDTGIGIWRIKDNKVVATVYWFQTNKETSQGTWGGKREFTQVKPYDVELIDVKNIDREGYSRRPFHRFELPAEFKNKMETPPAVKSEHLLMRTIYSYSIQAPPEDHVKLYHYLTKVPEMAKAGLSGLDIIQSSELIKKYIQGLL
jgi:hypothetical protein